MKRFTEPATPHDPFDDLMAAALHGDLSPQECADFETRLNNDPAARAAYQEAQAMHDLLDETHRNAQPDPRFEDRMISGVHRKLDEPAPRETAWGSVLTLWAGVKRVLIPARVPVSRIVLNGVVVLGICAILAGVALGPITNGIKPPVSTFAAIKGPMSVAGVEAKAKSFNRIYLPDSSNKPGHDSEASDAAPAPLSAPSPTVQKLQHDQQRLANLDRLESQDQAKTDADPGNANLATQVERVSQLKDRFAKKVEDDQRTAVASSNVASAWPSPSSTDASSSVAENAPPLAMGRSSASVDAPGQSPVDGVQKAPSGGVASAANAVTSTASSADKQTETSVAGVQATAPPSPQDARKLIRDAQLDLEVKSFQSTVDQITALAKAAGGYVDTSNSQRGGNGKLQGSVVVKVLPQNLDDFLVKLRGLGEVKNQSVGTQDVTKDYFDTQARLENSRRMETQLQDLLKRENGKVSDLLAVERELARVRGQIEEMQGQLKLYDFQVQYGTITLHIAEKDLKEAAAYLLKEQDNFALFATDVEATFQKARQAADDFKAQVLVANLDHTSGSDVSAQLDLMVAPDQIEPFLTEIRTLGRVANFTRESQRVANDGGDSSSPADDTLTERDKVRVQVAIRSDNEARKQVALTVVTKVVDDALSQAKAAALAQAGVSLLSSSLNKAPQGESNARLSVRVPGKVYPAVLEAFRALGRASALTVQRNDDAGPGVSDDDAPIILTLALTDNNAPVQKTELVVVTDNVDAQSQQIKKDAAAAGMEIRSSTFEGQTSGEQTARMTLCLPLGKYPAFLERLKAVGKVRSLSVARSDDIGPDAAGDDAPADIVLTLTHDDTPVQQTDLTLRTDDVGGQAQEIKQHAAVSGAEVKASHFERSPDGTEQATLTLTVPLKNYGDFIAALEKSGKVEALSVRRDDRLEDNGLDDSAPAQINLQLHNVRAIVAENDGLWPALRGALGDGFAALLGSIRVIGVLLALLAPWAAVGALFAWIARRIYVGRKNG